MDDQDPYSTYPPGPPHQSEPNLLTGQDAIAALVGTIVAGLLVLGGWKILTNQHATTGYYGTGLFMFAPLFCGFIAGAIAGWSDRRPSWTLWIISALQCVFLTTELLVFGIEGAVCIVMAMPLRFPM